MNYEILNKQLKAATWKPMNSFVHGGVHAVVQGLRGIPPEKLIKVLINANGLALMNAQALVIGLADPRLTGRIREVQALHSACLPT